MEAIFYFLSIICFAADTTSYENRPTKKTTMRRILVTLTHRDIHKHEGPWTYLIPMNNAYSKVLQIPFHHAVIEKCPEDRHISWARVSVLQTLVKDYDEIIFFSECVTMLDMTQNIFELLGAAAKDQPILSTFAEPDGSPSTALFLLNCRNKLATETFLRNWWTLPYEQITLANWKSDTNLAPWIHVGEPLAKFCVHITPDYKSIQSYEAKRLMYRLLHRKNKRVGLYVRQSNYYASGAGQNVIFMKHSLEAAGYNVDLLVDYNPKGPNIVDPQVPYTYTHTQGLDFSRYAFILYGSYIPSLETCARIRSAGIRTALFHPMNSFDAIHNDHFIHNIETSVPLLEEQFHNISDTLWLSHNHEFTYKNVLEIQNQHKVNIYPVPLLWTPLFTLDNGIQYKYQNRPSGKMNIIIMEPNMSYCKSSWMPLVIAEAFYMKHKDSLNKVYLFGNQCDEGLSMLNQFMFVKDGKLKRTGRMAINEILKCFCAIDPNSRVAVISHNIQIPLNYAYYDVMNAGIPFLHNSNILEIGYFYTHVDTGVSHLETILSSHNAETYERKVQHELAKWDPYNETNVRIFESLIET
jgi:hypothetical protein